MERILSGDQEVSQKKQIDKKRSEGIKSTDKDADMKDES
jgi:hypothetical protein